jgi:hypothetical protein
MPAVRTLLAFFFLASCAAADELRTFDKTYTGKVASVTDKEVIFKTNDGMTVPVPLDKVIALDLQQVKGVPAGTKYTDIRLIDDTLLHCESFNIKGKEKEVEINLFSKQKLTVPLAHVAYILKDAYNPTIKDYFDATIANKVKLDRVIAYNAEKKKFTLFEGVLGDPDPSGTKIKFRPQDQPEILANLEKIHALIFYRDNVDPGSPVCLVIDVTGNALAAKSLSLDGNKVTVTTLKGATVAWDKDAIARMDYSMGKLAFLSDMEPNPKTKVERSAVGLIVAYRRDVNLDGEPIQLGGEKYAKGLSLHAHTELEYDLRGKYKKFTATLGIDPRVGAESQPTVTIQLDGKSVFSQTLSAKDLIPLNFDITKVGTLRIVVTSNNPLDLHDHVTIANPKVSQ